MRAHANFIEGVPLALILFALIEFNGGSRWLVHALGAPLVVSRLVHPFGMSTTEMIKPARMVGAGGTFLVVAFASIAALWIAVPAMLR